MKVLNLYAGIGGNRKLWQNCEVTSIEIDPAITGIYSDLYPDDVIIIGDAHNYLLNHYQEFDFIWSSPPCPTHGQYRYNVGFRAKGYKAVYPDMKLYEEIIFLKHYFKSAWVVENVKPFYTPLIAPSATLGRHLFWSNFDIPAADFKASNLRVKNKISDFDAFEHVAQSNITNKRQVLRNCVDPELGLHVLNASL